MYTWNLYSNPFDKYLKKYNNEIIIVNILISYNNL